MLFSNINKSILPFISSGPVERIGKRQNIKVVAKAATLVPVVRAFLGCALLSQHKEHFQEYHYAAA